MAERKKVIVVAGASQGIGGGSGQRISQRGLPCCRHVTINKTCAVAPGVIKTPMLPVKRDMTCWQIASGRQDRGTYQVSWERSCILKQLRSRQARSRTSPPFEANHVVMGYWAGWVTSAIFVHQFIAVRTSHGRRIVWYDDWSSPFI